MYREYLCTCNEAEKGRTGLSIYGHSRQGVAENFATEIFNRGHRGPKPHIDIWLWPAGQPDSVTHLRAYQRVFTEVADD